MSTFEIVIALANAPTLVGILVWIIKVETRLIKIETVCKMKHEPITCNVEGR